MPFTTSRLREQFQHIMSLRQTGQQALAEMLTGKVLAAVPGGADDLYCQASLLLQMGRTHDALKRFDQARSEGPVSAELMVDRGVALLQLRRFDEALESCTAALALKPRFAPALLIGGDTLQAMNRPEEALAWYGEVLAHQRDFVPALRNRATLLTAMERFEEALADLHRLTRLMPGEVEIHNNHSLVLGELGRFEEALRSADRAVAINPRHARAWHNRGVVLWSMERHAEALASYDRALAANPALHATLSNRANTLQELLRLDESMAAHDRVVAMQPDYASGHWNRSRGNLLRGEWTEGLKEFEWRKKRPGGFGEYLAVPQPEWLGTEDLNGKTLLVRAEQGLGDTLHFVRYCSVAQNKGARVILAVQDPLVRLLRDGLVPPADSVIGKDAPLPSFDYHIPTMSLPYAFRTEVSNVPGRVPYLKAEESRVEAWRAQLGDTGIRIGVCWHGRRPGNDLGRAFPLALLSGIARLPGVRLISLQKGVGEDQLTDLPPGMSVETLGANFDSGPEAFLDSAAVMESLDLVISSDTAIAHLAGALARPVWLATKFVPEWRWLLGRGDSVWYPTMRLFRQPAMGDWDSVFAAMENSLKALIKRG